MKKLICIFILIALTSCAQIHLKKGDLEFTHTRLFDKQQLENLKAEGVNGMDISLGKHNSEADIDTLIRILESLR